MSLPITCPTCTEDVELLHLFFDYPFASNCWHAFNLVYDMHDVQSAPQWVLINKLETAKHEEAVNICIILWGIWFWRNKKVWNNQVVNPAIAMEHSFNIVRDWRTASQKTQLHSSRKEVAVAEDRRWKPPAVGTLKLNVDASFDPGGSTFSVGMVIRDSEGSFV